MTYKILVVDDEVSLERLIKQRFRKSIRDRELEFIFAHNGKEALEKLVEESPIAVILTDINMPEMDGLTLLEKLSELEGNLTLKTVVVSAYGDLQNIRTAMNRGAFDFLTKPIDFDDLEITINRTLEYVQKMKQNLKALHQAQAQLIQSEKMVSIGQLVAGVAHEINNPIGFISGNIDHIEIYIRELLNILELYQTELPSPSDVLQEKIEKVELDFVIEDLPKLVASMKEGTERIRNISTSLRTFSRSDTVQKVPFNIHEGIESTLMILMHRLKGNKHRPDIKVIKDYGELPLVECYPGQLNQVFMNIIANAIDAIEESNQGYSYEEIKANSKVITIKTELGNRESQIGNDDNRDERARLLYPHAIIRISDNGLGMPESVRENIFNPFFTTKQVGVGTGLGLSISWSIVVEKHGGRIDCISNPENGSEFIIEIPIYSNSGGG
ncbi:MULTISPECIES: sensor histidine kinase [Kamptonema]|uniref:sensor histidine kinase n=1 Tax=Kamptonema TaxID=1501433 RepID=UPI0001DAD293|nr:MULTISPECIES: response regulator [Kamptonema]CBN58836.1 putative Sensor protein [Kamptonema sp. PCC 6506]